MRVWKCLAAAVMTLCATPVLAGGFIKPAGDPASIAKAYDISEIRGGLAIDDVELYSSPFMWTVPRFETIHPENLDTASFDVLFRSPDIDAFRWIGSPRPVLGVDLNLRHESMIHASLNWHLPIANTGLFAEAEVGGALHNGELTGAVSPMRNLGCRTLFYWSVNVGYQFDNNWSIMATEQHASQDGICGWPNNQGLNYEGIRIGYKF